MSQYDPIVFDELRAKLAREMFSYVKQLESFLDSLPDKVESRNSRIQAFNKLTEFVAWNLKALRDDQIVDERSQDCE